MRVACPEERLDSLPISGVGLNLDCRDEIIPILRAQHMYGDDKLRRELLGLVGKDVNGNSNRKLGRRGMNYWEITVLAAARLGCNLDYDKLQDLAENHRGLRQIMGIGNWEEEVDFGWRRIEDNLIKLRPETLKKINALIVQAGHAQVPNTAERAQRGPVVGRKNYYGSGAEWSGRLAAMLFSLFQTISLAQLNPRLWLTAYLNACAAAGGQAPADADQYLPWNLTDEQKREWSSVREPQAADTS